ncbi:MAG: efflux RND transporter permease subunit, partial [Pseudomonadota bacterium]
MVLTAFPGASAERVERLVSQRIEDRLREVEEIDNISSTSSTGLSSVQIQLHDRIVETEQAFSIVRDAVSDVIPLLPEGAATPQFIDNRNYAFTLITALVWSADSPPNELILKRSAEELQARLRNVPGTEYTNIQGTSPEEISVSVRADLAQSLGLSEQDVALALAAADAKISAGQIFGPANEIAVEVRGGFNNLDRIRNVPLRRGPDGAQVLVGDVATVSRGLQEPSSEAAYIDGRPAVVVGTRIDDGLRVGLWSERVREELRAFEAELSSGIDLQLIFDQSVYARKRFITLLQNLAVGIGLVTVILFFTLGPRAACLVTLAIPLTTFLSLAIMNLFGIPIHQMSITGLIVALGLLVDAAIVTVDAIGRALKKGVDARQAVSESVRRLLIPLSSSTATTVLAFMPITLLPGSAGEFVGPIADSVIIALIASLFLALTAIAALAGRFLKPSVGDTTKSSGGLDIPGLGNGFRCLLDRSLAAPRVSIAVSLVLPVLGFLGVTTLPSQFFPAADRTQFHVQLVLPPQSSLAATEEAA